MHQRETTSKLLKENQTLSLCFIAFILIALLVIFSIMGQDATEASAIPTSRSDQQSSDITAEPAVSAPPAIFSKKVVIDPGHGGFDVGTMGSGNYANEDALNLSIALKVGNYLSQLGITPVYTRSTSAPVADSKEEDMQTRLNIINTSGAELAVSIHLNSYPEDSSVKGPEVYYYDGIATTQRSAAIAASMQSALNMASNGKRSSKHGDYMVIRDVSIPAILIECGFLSNPAEEANLNKEAYQDKLAQTIANCIYQSLA